MTGTVPAAVLFDMDGLLVDTESMWYRVECEVANALGATWSVEDSALMLGGPIGKVVDFICARVGADVSPSQVSDLLAEGMTRALTEGPIDWRPGSRALLTGLRERQVPRALVSASLRAQVDAVLGWVEQDLPDAFLTTLSAEDCPRTKPYPDPYLEAASRLGVSPRACVVLEDSPTGVQAGSAAGAYVVAVPHVVDIPARPGVHVVRTLEGVTPDDLAAWSRGWIPPSA